MKIRSNTIFMLVVLELCFFLMPLFAYDDKEILIEEFPSLVSRNEYGYDVYNYRLENLTSKRQTVEIIISVDNSSYADIEVTKQVELVGNESRIEKVFFPVKYSSYRGKARFYLNGKIIDTISLDKGSSSYSRNKIILMDKGITGNDTDRLFKDSGLDWSDRNYSVKYFESNLDMMDKDWIAYYQFAALMFKAQTFKEMPSAVQSAIMDYVKAGGMLIIMGYWPRPDGFWGGREQSLKYRSTSGVNGIYSVGLGKLAICDSDLFRDIKSTPANSSSTSSYGYGSRNKKEEKDKKTVYTPGVFVPKDILRELNIKGSDRRNEFKVEDCYNREYRAMTSVSLIIVLVFVFAILLGPVNFYFLNLYGKRILIFVTVPLISLVCCSVIFLYFLCFEYGRLDVFRQSFVLLDENSNTSIVWGGEVIISGKALNDSLVFPLNSIIDTNSGYLGSRNSGGLFKGIKLDKSQNFNRNWIRAKEPFRYTVLSVKQDRSRVEFYKNGDNIEILNGLGADIAIIYYRDEYGRIYQGSNIKAGIKASIDKLSGSINSSNGAFDLYNLLKNYTNQKDIMGAAKSFVKYLRRDEYFVYLESDPFLKQDLDQKANIREMGCFVYGKPKKEAAK